MVPIEALEMSSAIQSKVVDQQRISVTELARGTTWRKKLVDCKILEVADRGSTIGWLLSQEGMSSLLETISYFESEAERAQMAYLIEVRKSHDDWKSGAELTQAVADNVDETLTKLKAVFDAC